MADCSNLRGALSATRAGPATRTNGRPCGDSSPALSSPPDNKEITVGHFDDFDRQFDRDFRATRRLAVGTFIFTYIVVFAILAAVGVVAYKVLVHFGIL